MNRKKHFEISDKPIADESEDKFGIVQSYVEPIFNFINESSIHPITIAVTGEWGSGKTSIINLLKNKLYTQKRYSIIDFDPLLEGKLEIIDLLKLFCIKLCSMHNDESIIKKCSEIIAAITNIEISASIPTHLGVINAKYNPGKAIKRIIDISSNKKDQLFTEQLRGLNECLERTSTKVCIVIDEIDRLTAKNIVNFLLFARVLEVLNNIVCIIGLDYERVITKLINEKYLGASSYNDVIAYVDKLFQLKYHICLSEYDKRIFAVTKLCELDTNGVLRKIYEPEPGLKETNRDEEEQELWEIISYLCTPRQIKKWLITIYSTYNLIKAFPDKISLLKYLAVEIKHPVINEYVSRFTLTCKNKYNNNVIDYAKKEFGINISMENTKDQHHVNNCVVLATAGIEAHGIEKVKNCKELLTKVTCNPISDSKAEKFLISFFNKAPYFLLEQFVERRYFSENKDLMLYIDFFENDPNHVLECIINDTTQLPYILASDVAKALKDNVFPKDNLLEKVNLKLINKLWCKNITQHNFNIFSNPYHDVAIFLIHNVPLELVIKDSWCHLSEATIGYVLAKCGIRNVKGAYNLDDFKLPDTSVIHESKLKYCKFKNKGIALFCKETIKEILCEWVNHIKSELSQGSDTLFLNENAISVFYRYVQWQKTIEDGANYQEKLANDVKNYLQSEIAKNKKNEFLSILNNVCHMYLKPIVAGSNDQIENILIGLFNKNAELLNTILELIDDSMKYLKKLCVELLAQTNK